MSSVALFALGQREVSPAAAEAAHHAAFDVSVLFDRHERGDWGDWGDVPEWLHRDNANAARVPTHSHVIQSHYKLAGLPDLLVATARDRSRTRLMLLSEFGEREVSVQDGYALWARDYDYPNPLIGVEESITEAILSRLLPVRTALDVGTGTGRLALKLARGGVSEVVGIDATPEMLEVARRTAQLEGLDSVRFEEFQLSDTPLLYASNTFDLLTCGLMLSHVADLRGALQEYVRVVRPGGWVLVSDFHPAVSQFGWRTDYVTPDARYLMPNPQHTRAEYLDALTDAECAVHEIHDIALSGEPYGDVSDAALAANEFPPLCLVVLAQKPPLT